MGTFETFSLIFIIIALIILIGIFIYLISIEFGKADDIDEMYTEYYELINRDLGECPLCGCSMCISDGLSHLDDKRVHLECKKVFNLNKVIKNGKM